VRPIYAHGIGAISSFGSWTESIGPLQSGQSAIAGVRSFDATGFPSPYAAEISQTWDHQDRRLALARQAAAEASCSLPPGRLGVFVGAESGRATWQTVIDASRAAGGGEIFDHDAFDRDGPALSHRFDTATLSPATVAIRLGSQYGATGPIRTLSLACSSSLAAVVDAVRALQCGACEVALVGGVGADVDPLMLAGFGLLGALSSRGISRPFDRARDGFVVGEGAAFAVLSIHPSDVRVAGVGRSLDAYHLTKPHPDGLGARKAISDALGNQAPEVVIAHGTSTPLNDAVEAAAIADLCPGARVSSVKGALGHWIAGAGALGLVSGVEVIRSGRLPAVANLERPDFDLDFVGPGQSGRFDRVLVNAFAFGGANSAVVVERV